MKQQNRTNFIIRLNWNRIILFYKIESKYMTNDYFSIMNGFKITHFLKEMSPKNIFKTATTDILMSLTLEEYS